MKKPSKSKVIIIPNPPQNASKQDEVVQNNVPVEACPAQAAPAPAQAPAQTPPVQAEAEEKSE
ncbi:hypothetical protein J6U76_00635 [bacterium]|nr:hypothetical protein [bacterium]